MTEGEIIRILIADDHAIVREGLRALIETEPGMELVGEAQDGIEAVRKHQALHPDVTLLDLVMPRQDGLAALTEIRQKEPQARILVLTSFAEDERVFPAIMAGALGYLSQGRDAAGTAEGDPGRRARRGFAASRHRPPRRSRNCTGRRNPGRRSSRSPSGRRRC